MKRATAVLGLLVCILEARGDDPKPALGRTLLFVDDHDILYRSGTQRVMTQPTRHPSSPLLVAMEKRWETAIGWTSIYRDPKTGKYQLWYQAYFGKRAGDRKFYCVVAYAESKDGIVFERPELDLFPHKEFAKSNIVLLSNGGYGDRYCNSVVVDENEKDPAKRYKMAYYDWSVDGEREYAGLHVAFSPDGIHWTKHGKGPLYKTSYGGRGLSAPFEGDPTYTETVDAKKVVRRTWMIPFSMSDAVDVFWDPVRRCWVIYGKFWISAPDGGHAWKHAMGRTQSTDFIHWTKPELILAPDDRDPPWAEFHTTPVFHYQDRYFCLNQVMDRRIKQANNIELMTSKDGYTWDRSFRDTYFLPRSEKPSLFDSRSMYTNSTPIVLEDEIRFYYGAYSMGTIGGKKLTEKDQRSGVGMASIPRDRFAGIRPVAKSDQMTIRKPLEHIGQITLKALDLKGVKEILVNADAKDGVVWAELLNEEGYRIRGYCKEDAAPLEGDSLRHTVAWKEKRVEELPPGRYLLRLHLNKATAYAVTFR